MKSYDVLIVEDDKSLREALLETLTIEGYQAETADNGKDALSKLASHNFRLVVSDVQMPQMDGVGLLRNMQMQFPEIPVLLMTAYGTVPRAVAAMQSGAADYLIKPFEADVLVEKVRLFLQEHRPVAQPISTTGSTMQQVYTIAERVAQTNVTVLLQGESGSGKEVLARYIHQHSRCAQGPFVAINCAAIPENMLEAILFGYEKGAFTGAVQASAGKFEQAQGGTLLLDEISEMDLSLQAKLLRVLQEKEVERLGSQKKILLDVRFLATTNRKLKQYVEQGEFREDLYYRLSVFPLKIPPLRERLQDITSLAKDLLLKHAESGKVLPVFSDEAIAKIHNYEWPGNVRELENVIQRALILQQNGYITTDHLVFDDQQAMPNLSFDRRQENHGTDVASVRIKAVEANDDVNSLGEGVRSAEEKIILQTLNELNGSRKLTAETLGISPRTLRYKLARMKESGIVVPC